MRKGDRVRLCRDNPQIFGGAVVLGNKVLQYLPGMSIIERLTLDQEGEVLGTRASAGRRGGLAIVRWDKQGEVAAVRKLVLVVL